MYDYMNRLNDQRISKWLNVDFLYIVIENKWAGVEWEEDW
jgi:hypothetical protein